MNARAARRVLSTCLPELPLRSVRRLGGGWDSDAFLVNGGTDAPLVFRFPKRAPVATQLERELRLLPVLGPTLPAPIPRFSHVVRECGAASLPFAGYPLLLGRQLSHLRLSPIKRSVLAGELGRFLASLHAFPATKAAALGVQPADAAGGSVQLLAFLERAHGQIGPLLGEAERSRFASWLASLPASDRFAFTPVLIHGDLHTGHILVDAATGGLSGVIDFGDTRLGDAALDFADLLSHPGAAFARQTLAAYGVAGAAAETLLRRAAVYVSLAPLQEALFGLYVSDEGHIEAGLAALRKTIASCNS